MIAPIEPSTSTFLPGFFPEIDRDGKANMLLEFGNEPYTSQSMRSLDTVPDWTSGLLSMPPCWTDGSELSMFKEDEKVDESIELAMSTLNELESQTYETSLHLKEGMSEGKGTAAAYRRHFQNYASFIAERHSNLPAIPITATKVALFLEIETKRPKVHFTFYIYIVFLLVYSAPIMVLISWEQE